MDIGVNINRRLDLTLTTGTLTAGDLRDLVGAMDRHLVGDAVPVTVTIDGALVTLHTLVELVVGYPLSGEQDMEERAANARTDIRRSIQARLEQHRDTPHIDIA